MTEIGSRLRRAREQAGLDIQEISARTKIQPVFLHAIERGTFEQLPGHFFTRTFLKAYAREVSVSADEVVAEYDAARRPVEVAPEPPLPRRPIRRLARGLSRNIERDPVPGLGPVLALAALLLFIASMSSPDRDPGVEPGAVGTSGVVAAGVAAAGVAGAVPLPQPEPVPDRLTLDIAPSAQIWVTATADGERVLYRLLQAGERVRVDARREMSFRIGDAAAFEYSINGAPGKPLGGAGQVREFQITGENYRSYWR